MIYFRDSIDEHFQLNKRMFEKGLSLESPLKSCGGLTRPRLYENIFAIESVEARRPRAFLVDSSVGVRSDQLLEPLEESPIVKVVKFDEAIQVGASKIIVDVDENKQIGRVRYKIQGSWFVAKTFRLGLLRSIRGRCKILACLDLSEKTRDQHGIAIAGFKDISFPVMISTLPHRNIDFEPKVPAEVIVIHILLQEEIDKGLENFIPQNDPDLMAMLQEEHDVGVSLHL